MVLKGSVNFGPRGSTALGFGGHAHRAFPNTNATQMLDATFKLLESNPEYINADVLWVTDFVMNLVSEDRLEKMQTLRSEGTRFYGLRIGLNQHQWEPYFDQIKTIGYVDSQVY